MPKGPIFHVPPQADSEDDSEAEAAKITKPNLDFDDILNGMGGSGILSHGESDEEEKKEPASPYGHSGPRVFRPNLSATGRFTEDL